MMSNPAKLLRELIALPSVNPAFLPANDPHAGEKRIAEFLATLCTRAGLDVESRPVFPNRANLVAALRPTGKMRRRVLLAPHLDTVGGPEVPGKLFCPRLVDGRLHGRGACDTKGSVAVMLSALLRLRKRPAHTEIVFVGLVDEEYLQSGSRALANSGYRVDLAIIGEPTRLKVVTAHKGAVWLHIETCGKAAHGARPELGRNAVYEMAEVINVLKRQKLTAKHPLLGQPTISVGSIKGGSQPNIVPDHCIVSVDRRTIPGETDATVIAGLNRLFRKQGLRPRISKIHPVPCPALDTSARLPLVQQFMRVARQSRPAGVVFFSDAAVLASGGIPSVLFGPGDIAQAHTADEWVSLNHLDRGVAILSRFLESLE